MVVRVQTFSNCQRSCPACVELILLRRTRKAGSSSSSTQALIRGRERAGSPSSIRKGGCGPPALLLPVAGRRSVYIRRYCRRVCAAGKQPKIRQVVVSATVDPRARLGGHTPHESIRPRARGMSALGLPLPCFASLEYPNNLPCHWEKQAEPWWFPVPPLHQHRYAGVPKSDLRGGRGQITRQGPPKSPLFSLLSAGGGGYICREWKRIAFGNRRDFPRWLAREPT